jgi:fructokinase
MCAYHTTASAIPTPAIARFTGTAWKARWGQPARELSGREDVWELEADYLALAVVNYIVVVSPELVILGGGVMDEPSLLGRIQRKVLSLLGGYVQHPLISERITDYIVRPELGNRAGVVGALALAMQAASA